ncbi:hypothetical protein L7F22_028128 [Adiantum nelumboides]|nr:hypothetical protein [Adiantum nelumboides]
MAFVMAEHPKPWRSRFGNLVQRRDHASGREAAKPQGGGWLAVTRGGWRLQAAMGRRQVHLLVHLVDEVEIAGTVHARWMFFLERFMKTLKGFVRQRARPEGSMAEGWMVQESCVFISEYLTHSQNNIIELWNIKDDERVVSEVPQGNGVVKRFSEAE